MMMMRSKQSVLIILLLVLVMVIQPSTSFHVHHRRQRPRTSHYQHQQMLSSSSNEQDEDKEEVVDVIVIGAGIGGLCTAALSAKYGFDTLCLEAHDTAGGCAHSFDRYSSASKTIPFQFDSGPSLISGLSSMGSKNPLRQVLDAIGTASDIEWKTYDGWIVHDKNPHDTSAFKLTTGDGGEFEKAIEQKAGVDSRIAFEKFKTQMLKSRGLSEASGFIPPFALRGDIKAVASLFRYTLKLLSIGSKGTLLTGPFSKVMDLYDVHDPFVRKWFDYIAFALSGLDASNTQAAPVSYMMNDLHKHGAVLDYPMGGMNSLINAIVSGLQNHGGNIRLNTRVESMILKDNGRGGAKCKGVVLSDGKIIRARKGVVCNAPLWNTARILEDSVVPSQQRQQQEISSSSSSNQHIADAVKEVRKQADEMCMTRSFMHLHLGIPKDGIPDDLECHHSVLDLSADVTAEQNMVIISIPTVFDPSLAPEGYHIVHAYTAACDNFDQWEKFLDGGIENGKVGCNPNSSTAASYGKAEEYQKLKQEKAEVLWEACERVIPDVRKRAKRRGSISLVATPLSHRRYNQRFKGTYGPAPRPGDDIWKLAGAKTPIDQLLMAGDCCFPGIGLPGVAASGTIAANTLATVKDQTKLMKELKAKGALQ